MIPEWLRNTLQEGESLSLELVAARVGLAMLLGFVVAVVYTGVLGRRKSDPSTLATTLVLLTVLISLVTLVIGNSIARAFGLVGALSIVRFRTVVEDTRDTAFVIFAVAVGMACGAGYGTIALLSIPSVAIAAGLMRSFDRGVESSTASLTVRLGLHQEPDDLLKPIFAKHLAEYHITGAGTAKQGASIELTYTIVFRPETTLVKLLQDLTHVEGVQNVTMREQ